MYFGVTFSFCGLADSNRELFQLRSDAVANSGAFQVIEIFL